MEDLLIVDQETLAFVEKLAALTKKSPAEVVRDAVEHEIERERDELPFLEFVKALQDELKAMSQPGGLPADKAFYDELSGEYELTGIP